jgi:hypothetical protein
MAAGFSSSAKTANGYAKLNSLKNNGVAPRARFELATLRLTAKVVEILNALSCVAYRGIRLIVSPSVGLLGLPPGDRYQLWKGE